MIENVKQHDLIVEDCLATAQEISENAVFNDALEFSQVALALITELKFFTYFLFFTVTLKVGKYQKIKLKSLMLYWKRKHK